MPPAWSVGSAIADYRIGRPEQRVGVGEQGLAVIALEAGPVDGVDACLSASARFIDAPGP